MPELDVRNRGRRPRRSTIMAKKIASNQFVMAMIPLSLFWNSGSVMPASVRILLLTVSLGLEVRVKWTNLK